MGDNCDDDSQNTRKFQLKIEPDKLKKLKVSVNELKQSGQ
jgi:hypothetical protein